MSIESVEANRFNEYKVVLDDVNRRRSRRQATNQLFIAINSFFLAALGAMLLSSRLTTWWTAAALVPITGFALALNGTWLRLLSRYAALLDAQSRYLEALEAHLDATGRYQTVDVDGHPDPVKFGQLLYLRRTLLKAGFDPRHALTNLERRIALIFVAAYPIITLIVATVTYLITQHYLPPAAP